MNKLRISIIVLALSMFSLAFASALCGPNQLNGFYDSDNIWHDAYLDVWDCPEFGVHYTVVTNGPEAYNGTFSFSFLVGS